MVFDNSVPAGSIEGVQWVKSSASVGQGNCVELAKLPSGEVAMRNSRYPDGVALVYTREEIVAFLKGAKGSEFDHLTV
ncbi:DUF397 domain-containing protein [Streptomyces griseocarneus]|uniref:DUF397 domain-containing protein n=1 Tax=Streptomyces griseocarneus TaxID=51201 RepID=UPI00167CD859|nr:DUF397 domain-containing protein [Streptomyces griseocarneus]MBZ6474086.1 DUF397 domain-containing protein [Streptomyces griseocarneus]GHG52028.1 transcriptional regulator [Streptomyces griseocarneus]